MRNYEGERLEHHFGDALVWEVLQHVDHALERGGALGSHSQEKGCFTHAVWIQDLQRQSSLCESQLVILLLIVVPSMNLLN